MTVSGVLTCSGKPIPFSEIRLVQDIGIIPNSIAIGEADENGRFSITAKPFSFVRRKRPLWELSLYVGLKYTYKSNSRRAFAVNPRFAQVLDFHEGVHDIGEVAVHEYPCNTYIRLYNALKDFNTRTGRELRAIRVAVHNLPKGSVPFSEYRRIRLPIKYLLTDHIARHELAHVARNVFDGDSAHFEQDVEAYGGTETHNCQTKSSTEFAFNEGWAFYWARECQGSTFNRQKDVGGDVAKLLRELQEQCNTSDNDMWVVLEKNPGKIHTYDEYENAHKSLHSCP